MRYTYRVHPHTTTAALAEQLQATTRRLIQARRQIKADALRLQLQQDQARRMIAARDTRIAELEHHLRQVLNHQQTPTAATTEHPRARRQAA